MVPLLSEFLYIKFLLAKLRGKKDEEKERQKLVLQKDMQLAKCKLKDGRWIIERSNGEVGREKGKETKERKKGKYIYTHIIKKQR